MISTCRIQYNFWLVTVFKFSGVIAWALCHLASSNLLALTTVVEKLIRDMIQFADIFGNCWIWCFETKTFKVKIITKHTGMQRRKPVPVYWSNINSDKRIKHIQKFYIIKLLFSSVQFYESSVLRIPCNNFRRLP